ncbi:MAG TPA: hypothetical protein VM870_05360, partial [Pyrinomonadaceae bacterium]|nr:hypothetical protein [Pyrinomonadaceae bacterium]
GLSLDNNLTLHGLSVDRAGNVYIIEDSMGAADTVATGGNGGTPRVSVFPDPALNGYLRDGEIFTALPENSAHNLSGLAFGSDPVFGAVGSLELVNSAAPGDASIFAARDGLGTVRGVNLTLGAAGRTPAEAAARGVSVRVEGRDATVLSFDDSHINIHVPAEVQSGTNAVVVTLNGNVTASEDVTIKEVSPALFTIPSNGSGEVVALLISGQKYTVGPFITSAGSGQTTAALFGTGWRNALPATVKIGGQAATIEYAGPVPDFPGLDQINVVLPPNTAGANSVLVTAGDGAQSQSNVVITLRQ